MILARRPIIPLDNDEAHDCDPDLPPWKVRDIERPRWTARNPHERKEMIYWVIQQLEKLEVQDATTPKGRAALRRLIGKKALRKILAPSNTSRKDDQDVANWALNAAVDTVPLIRQLWQDEYGLKNRHRDDGASAEEIAAYLFDVKIAHVISRSRKPSGGPRGKHKPKIALPAPPRK
ncbi:hypothetical protein ACVIHC_005424 [Bradyrhizobium diazoefficiens]